MNNLDRVAKAKYIPTQQDIIQIHIRTTGLLEHRYKVGGMKYTIVDVGFDRDERSKWIHSFKNTNAILFVSAINEYDMTVVENDEVINRVHYSIKMFQEICNNPYFLSTPTILLLNKIDVFKEKMKRVNLSACFEDYEGGLDDEGLKFITSKFLEVNETKKKVHVFPICATDSSCMERAFTSINDVIKLEK